jgi:hypothetical protein
MSDPKKHPQPLRPVPSPEGYLRVVRRRLPDRQHTCSICSDEIARASTYEFCRAKEVFFTTHISYRSFLNDYLEVTIGFPISYQHLLNHINNHVRPALRREIREMAIEDGRGANPPELSDFLVAPYDAVERTDRTSNDHQALRHGNGKQPEEDPDTTAYPELKNTITRDWRPDEDDQLGRTYERFWNESGDAASQTESPTPTQETDNE